MTNAQDVTYHAVKDLIAAQGIGISPPVSLHEGAYAAVLFEVQRGGENLTFLIEAGGCLARVHA